MDAEIQIVDPTAARKRLAPPTREKREAQEVPADDCQWHEEIIGILVSSLKVSGKLLGAKYVRSRKVGCTGKARVAPFTCRL